jgi:plastocyanin
VKRFAFLLVVVALAAGLAGCGKDNKVGDDKLLNFEDQANARLGSTTTTAPPAETTSTTTGGNKAGVGQTTTTTAKQATTTTQAAAFEIVIKGDESPTQFNPAEASIYVNTLVRWTNGDTVARSVRAADRTFVSPSIPPGGTFTWRATKTGRINYSDGTRPYAVGALEVAPR